jgi:hypothetical protein
MGNIIFLASYPKSGNTWLRVFLINLFANARRPLAPGRASDLSTADNTEYWYTAVDSSDPATWTRAHVARLRHKMQRELASRTDDTIFIKSHAALLPMEGVPPFAPDVLAGAVYIVRNPLDIAPSYARHNQLAIHRTVNVMNQNNFITARRGGLMEYLQGGWSQNVLSWTRAPNPRIHVMRYEDMVADPLAAFGGLTRFLQLEVTPERLERAVANSSIDTLRDLEDKEGFHEQSREGVRFFGQGGVDAWKRDLPEAQARRIVERHRAQMARFNYVPAGW